MKKNCVSLRGRVAAVAIPCVHGIASSLVLLAMTAISCGGGSSSSTTSSGLNDADSLTGTVYAPNGIDPVAGATVYVPQSGSASLVKISKSIGKLAASDGTTCDEPTESACAKTCTLASGAFSLDTSSCSTQSTLKIVKGELSRNSTISCSTSTCTMGSSDTTFASSDSTTSATPNMAVVTGMWDDIEDVLAKLGFGSVDSTGHLDKSKTFQFTLFDGDNSLGSTYQDFDKLLDGTVAMSTYDIIFINCGNDFESYLTNSAVLTRISEFVSNGGKLYVTDLSYDFIEQIFPGFLKYKDDPNSATTAGGIGDAEDGTPGITVNATINNATMQSWLGNVTVIQHDSSTPGNPYNDCTSTYTTRTGALNSSNEIPIGDFLSGWAQITSAHTESGALSPTLWISSGSGDTFDGLDNRPLTASVSYGSNGGKIAYTSYHTAHSCATQYFWPQERVLQYLIFETL